MFSLLRTSPNPTLELSKHQTVLPEVFFLQDLAHFDAELRLRQVAGKPDLNCTKSPVRH